MDVTGDMKSVGVRERDAEDETVRWRQMTESVLKKKKKFQIPKPKILNFPAIVSQLTI